MRELWVSFMSYLEKGDWDIGSALYNTFHVTPFCIKHMIENKYFELTTDTPYLTLTGELWGVYCEYYGENWPYYHVTLTLTINYHITIQLNFTKYHGHTYNCQQQQFGSKHLLEGDCFRRFVYIWVRWWLLGGKVQLERRQAKLRCEAWV